MQPTLLEKIMNEYDQLEKEAQLEPAEVNLGKVLKNEKARRHDVAPVKIAGNLAANGSV